MRSVRAWGPSTGPGACALAGRRCSLWGWRKGFPRGGAFHRCEGRLRTGAPPPLAARPPGGLSGSATHVLWARVCGCGGLALSPLACMPCGGCVLRGWWGAVPGGGGLPPLRGVSGVRRYPSPGRPSSGAGNRGSATRRSHVRSVRAWGPSNNPGSCALAGPRCSLWGWWKGVPRGGAFHRCEGRLRTGAPPPLAARPPGGLSGSATHVLWARVCGCGGRALSPLACMPCWGCVLRGWWGAVPGGGGLPPLRGASGVRRCPSPGNRSSEAGSRGSATRVSRVRLVRAWGPSTGPTACAYAGRRCALGGWRKGVPSGGAFRHREGRLRSGAPPLSAALVPGGLPGSNTHVLWAWVCGCGGPALSQQRTPLRAGGARCGGGGRASSGGVPFTVVRGV